MNGNPFFRQDRSSKRSTAVVALLSVLTVPFLATVPAAAQQAEGERLFRQRCGACHSIDPGQNKSGPHLLQVIGRPAGSIEGARYSGAMRASGIIWNGETLNTFLNQPRQMVPGTTMTVGVPDAAQRAAIIDYLESL
ncbi:MAG: cytochrome c family protein [Shinella sp.]|nr:cytochrome c family protein [Shinella sp.]